MASIPESVQILGFWFARHPVGPRHEPNAAKRLRSALAALEHAAGQMVPADRAAYMAIIRANAMVQARLAEAEAAKLIDGPESMFAR